uniref:Kelch repeat-containing protein n=1 Tax=Mangrovimonas aestuarii TaxID=3018443 RepID=UPI0023782703|nr:kelch repeat-containing protein [Mangrovimonas aestuarii]
MDVQGPSPRGFCAYAYNEERKTIILHGGRGNKGITYSDLWEWNGKKWIQLENESQFKADHHQLIYLNNKKTLLAFGGWNGNDVMGDTWTWDGEWKKLNISSPPKRASFAMVKDNKKDRVVLYGGLWVNGQYADIWEWSNNKWKSLSGMYDNSSIDHHSMIYNSKSECIIGFGGKDYRYQFQKKTFTIENGKIIVISDEGPSERHSFGFTYNGDKNLVYLYGGKEYVNGEQVALSDFWKWDGEKWKRIEYKNISKN